MRGVERHLWDYKANVACQAAMREEISGLMSVRGHNYEAHTAGISDPVAEITNRILNLESRIRKLEKKTRPVEKLSADLCGSDMHISQMRGILNKRYIEHESIEAVKYEIEVSTATYWRRMRELLRLARKYFGAEE